MSADSSSFEKVEALTSLIYREGVQACRDVQSSRCGRSTDEQNRRIQKVLVACRELTAHLIEPHEWMANAAFGYVDSIALSLLSLSKIHNYVPLNGSTISLFALGHKTGASVELIKRVMRQCVNNLIFDEVEPNVYRHNERSLCLLDDNFSSLVEYITADGLVTGSQLAPTLLESRYQVSDCPNQAAFQRAFNTEKSLYDYYNRVDPGRGHRFADAMAGHYNTPLDDFIETIFSFHTLPPDAVIVDVAGGKGHHSIRLAEQHPQMSFIVQDQASVVETVHADDLSEKFRQRIKWQAHELRKPQPVQRADVYILSHVLMDHNVSTCAEILRHITSAMIPQHSRVLVHDFVDPAPGEYASQFLNRLDFHMLASLNCFSKPLVTWNEIFHLADPKLQVKNISKGSKNAAVFELMLESA